MDVSHSYSSGNGVDWVDEIQVSLKGSPEANRRQLLQRLVQIIDSRCDYLHKVASADDKQYFLQNVVITENFGEANVVSAIISIRHMGADERLILGNIIQNHLGKPLELPKLNDPLGSPISGTDYDRTISRAPALHGYDPHGGERSPAFLFLLTCYWQDPCGEVKNIFGGNQTSPDDSENQQKTEPPYPNLNPDISLEEGSQDNYSDAHFEAMYTMARLSNRYAANCLKVMLPKAAASGSGETAEVATLGAGMAMRVITYDAERLGDWPQIPAMEPTYSSGDIAGTLLKYVVEQQPPVLSADGQKKIYRVQAKAVYGLNKMPTGNLPVGELPYTKLQDAEKVFNFEDNQLSSIGP
jgi:hypothetical protein